MEHRPEAFDPRGGATTSDHIDILGSQALNEALLQVAAGRGHEIGKSMMLPYIECVADPAYRGPLCVEHQRILEKDSMGLDYSRYHFGPC